MNLIVKIRVPKYYIDSIGDCRLDSEVRIFGARIKGTHFL